MRPILLWLMQSNFYVWLLKRVIPYIRFTTYYTRFTGYHFWLGYKKVQPGQFILTVDEQKLTSVLIPGTFCHAAMCVGKRNELNCDYEVAEMTHQNFTKSDFFDVCKEASRVVICECADWTAGDKAKMIGIVKTLFVTCTYDFMFAMGIKALYCSELVYQADKMGPNKMQCDLTDLAGVGRPYISPDGLLFAKNTRVVWDSDSELDGMMGPEAELYINSKKKGKK